MPIETSEVTNYLQSKLHPDSIIKVETADFRHYEIYVKSPDFQGISLVKQHQLILNHLAHYLAEDQIHAFKITTDVS